MYQSINQVKRLQNASKGTVFMIADKCPSCDSVLKRDMDRVREMCMTASKHGHRKNLVVIQQGNTLYSALRAMLLTDTSGHLKPPAYYYRDSWYANAEQLALE